MTDVNKAAPGSENNSTGAATQPAIYFLEDLSPGMTATFSKMVAEFDVVAFAEVSGDHNPIHLDEEYAAKTPFKTRIAHGILSASYISAALASRLPGPGAVYVGQTLKFKGPVRIVETVTARIEIIGRVPGKNFVTFKTQCFVGKNWSLMGRRH